MEVPEPQAILGLNPQEKAELLKKCKRCEESLPRSSFSKQKDCSDGLQTHCKECRKEYTRAWREKNRARYNALSRGYHAANPAPGRIRAARKKAAKLQRTPAWVDTEAISYVYYAAQVIAEHYGGTPHVDHIIPLQGEKVSGLHVHNNLQIISAKENLRKNNNYVT